MVKYGVLFEVRTEFLNNIQTSFGFRRLMELITSAVLLTYAAGQFPVSSTKDRNDVTKYIDFSSELIHV
jgi:hypothetical protein